MSSNNDTSNPQGSGSASEQDGVAFSSAGHQSCLKCHSKPASFECDPCGCLVFCTACARKMATGGRCKICGQFYGGLRRQRE
mmetsp:Transcript_1352/g.2966  ORF Transcript_1352/g.2966 Transcript_1352/m.2966 type:complete len:82 (+) Transcript_1352:131-376(+)|eukprot:CAMPEP_0172458028 /NCGR_PEP_ID=MMETSP1065-20121228/25635_1 /TAXON_ID=265537 /ORGANISM="Amphiprora paludosa, Strain CCMP125" /LENGTH=81 /DNA_ID=CAMNT_0013212095 /DNA_START=63 /DNA_END=308 /DNA_ORIENTATION=-